MSPQEIPSVRSVLAKGWPFLTVLIFLVWGLLIMRWEYLAPWYASVLMIALSFLNRDTWMTPERLIRTVRQIGELITQTAAIILPIAFVVSGLTITGVTGSVTSGLVNLGAGNIYLVLLLGIGACYILGMAGLSIVAYIFLAVTLAPAIISLSGLNVIAVHLFIVYYGAHHPTGSGCGVFGSDDCRRLTDENRHDGHAIGYRDLFHTFVLYFSTRPCTPRQSASLALPASLLHLGHRIDQRRLRRVPSGRRQSTCLGAAAPDSCRVSLKLSHAENHHCRPGPVGHHGCIDKAVSEKRSCRRGPEGGRKGLKERMKLHPYNCKPVRLHSHCLCWWCLPCDRLNVPTARFQVV